MYVTATDHRDRPTHQSRHAGVAVPAKRDNGAGHHRDRLRGKHDGPGTYAEVDNRHRDHGGARDRDWGSEDNDNTGRNHRNKHVRVKSRPVNRHEPRAGKL